mmetsp:Transcript_11691/g.24687  ORF Transcript_11691/g.24687 Transcript_11691/m.24687 type:complete len:211 (+) Transcript_11691:71-703(+)
MARRPHRLCKEGLGPLHIQRHAAQTRAVTVCRPRTNPQHSVAPPTSAASMISATTSKALPMAPASRSEKCLPRPPVAVTRFTQDSMTCTLAALRAPTVIIITLKWRGFPASSIRVTNSPLALSRRLPRSSPSVRQTSQRAASGEASPGLSKSMRHSATASKKHVPPAVSGRKAPMRASTVPKSFPFLVGGTTVSTLWPKQTMPTWSQSRT